MRPADFQYRRTETLDEAISMLARTEDAIALAGGQSLIPMLRFRIIRPQLVIDISRVSDLDGIRPDDGVIEIDAMVTTAASERSHEIQTASPLWAEASSVIGDPLVRNAGTVGGNLAHADPLNDLPAALVAARGHVVVRGPSGERKIEADDLIVGPLTTALQHDELISHVVLPTSSSGAYEKFKRAAADYGVAAVAVQLGLGSDGSIDTAGIAVTGANQPASRATEAEESLVGVVPTPDDIEEAAVATSHAASFTGDDRGSERYKTALVAVLARTALMRALERGRSGGP